MEFLCYIFIYEIGTILYKHLCCKSFPGDIIAVLEKFCMKHFSEISQYFAKLCKVISRYMKYEFHEIS